MSRDLLSGLLPSGDPFAPFDAKAYRAGTVVVPAALAHEPPTASAPPADLTPIPPAEPPESIASPEVAVATPIPPQDIPLAVPVFAEPIGGQRTNVSKPTLGKPRRKRRVSYAGPMMAAFALLMFLGIAGCLYLLVTGRGLSTDGRLVATGPDANKPNQSNDPVALENDDRQAFDPVMGSVRPGNSAPPGGFDSSNQMNAGQSDPGPMPDVSTPTELPMSGQSIPNGAMQPDAADAQMPDGQMLDAGTMQPEMTDEPDMSPEPPPEFVDGAMNPGAMNDGTKSDLQVVQAGEEALKKVRDVLRSGRFAAMAPAVAAAKEAMVSPEQKEELARYALLVELADYYIEGIRKGSASLGLGESFDLTPGFTVGVVEGTRDKIALKIGGKVKSYAIDDAPLIIADRLAKFALPEDHPEVVAGRAAHQALWSQATAAHRTQSIDWLEQVSTEAERFDAKGLGAAISRLFE